MFEFFDDDICSEPTQAQTTAPGHVAFDERGNAIYAWREDLAAQDGSYAERMRERALLNPALKLVDVDPLANSQSIHNDTGLHLGYNPYQSGQLAGKKPTVQKKTDMRELSKWIELKRRLGPQKPAGSKQ